MQALPPADRWKENSNAIAELVYAELALEKLGVEVLLNRGVEIRGKEGPIIGDILFQRLR